MKIFPEAFFQKITGEFIQIVYNEDPKWQCSVSRPLIFFSSFLIISLCITLFHMFERELHLYLPKLHKVNVPCARASSLPFTSLRDLAEGSAQCDRDHNSLNMTQFWIISLYRIVIYTFVIHLWNFDVSQKGYWQEMHCALTITLLCLIFEKSPSICFIKMMVNV